MHITVFEMITIIVVASIVAKLIQSYLQSRQSAAQSMDVIQAQQQQIDALEERVKALETIVTDANYDLKSKIDNL